MSEPEFEQMPIVERYKGLLKITKDPYAAAILVLAAAVEDTGRALVRKDDESE
jgi:hypothetical protein